jgi:acyl-coenzyme A synthetase/AMP-(fatty) acid ligase
VGLPLWNDSDQWKVEDLGAVKAPYEYRLIDVAPDAETSSSVGELAVRGPGLFSGYILHSGEIYKHPAGEWFRTGDLVERTTDGTLNFKGRKQSRIQINRHDIYPEEIENLLKRFPEIVEARVSAQYNPLRGDYLIAEIVPRDQTASPLESWLSLCEQELPPHLRPEELRVVTTIPRTGSGKVIRRAKSADHSA